ncbi:hypothetical protein GCM10010218_56160 [Streptomyces mashuensis]|uniref:Uncharacterized protein n=1 Tax=Streptomyces mashuensis TaxID=33904 RepID=A0A919EFW7_9ACTN|nr:hypothetical protein [Streptomyces mashuensis]GHF67447.1 hypothetical protein GCM10010218_56160 [Streptomyces mashuensis]
MQPTLSETHLARIRAAITDYGIKLCGTSGVPVCVPVRTGFPACPDCGRLGASVLLKPGTLEGGELTYEGCEHTFTIPR